MLQHPNLIFTKSFLYAMLVLRALDTLSLHSHNNPTRYLPLLLFYTWGHRYREVNAQRYMGLGQEQNPENVSEAQSIIYWQSIKMGDGARFARQQRWQRKVSKQKPQDHSWYYARDGLYYFPPEASFLLYFLRYHAPLLIFRRFPCWWLHLLVLRLTLQFRR